MRGRGKYCCFLYSGTNWKDRRYKNQYADTFIDSFLHDCTFHPLCHIGILIFQGILKLSPGNTSLKMPMCIIWSQEWHAHALWLSEEVRYHPRTDITYDWDSFLWLGLRTKLDSCFKWGDVWFGPHYGSTLDVLHKLSWSPAGGVVWENAGPSWWRWVIEGDLLWIVASSASRLALCSSICGFCPDFFRWWTVM